MYLDYKTSAEIGPEQRLPLEARQDASFGKLQHVLQIHQ